MKAKHSKFRPAFSVWEKNASIASLTQSNARHCTEVQQPPVGSLPAVCPKARKMAAISSLAKCRVRYRVMAVSWGVSPVFSQASMLSRTIPARHLRWMALSSLLAPHGLLPLRNSQFPIQKLAAVMMLLLSLAAFCHDAGSISHGSRLLWKPPLSQAGNNLISAVRCSAPPRMARLAQTRRASHAC